MRLRERDKRPVTFRARVPLKDDDGTTYEGWSPDGVTVRGHVSPAGGRVLAEQYGERLSYMLTMLVEGPQPVLESSGAWVYVSPDADEPDYKVVSVQVWDHTVMLLEKVR